MSDCASTLRLAAGTMVSWSANDLHASQAAEEARASCSRFQKANGSGRHDHTPYMTTLLPLRTQRPWFFPDDPLRPCRRRRLLEQAGRELLRRLRHRLLCDLRRARSGRRVRGGLRGVRGQADELLGHLEVAILVAQTFELEAEHRADAGGELAADLAADARRHPVAHRLPRQRQRLFRDVLEDAADLLPGRRAREVPDGAR